MLPDAVDAAPLLVAAGAIAVEHHAIPATDRCGQADFDALSTCQITNGVAWFIPNEQITGQPVEVLMTTIGRSPGVEVRLPADYFPPATAMVDLASSVKAHTERVGRCG